MSVIGGELVERRGRADDPRGGSDQHQRPAAMQQAARGPDSEVPLEHCLAGRILYDEPPLLQHSP